MITSALSCLCLLPLTSSAPVERSSLELTLVAPSAPGEPLTPLSHDEEGRVIVAENSPFAVLLTVPWRTASALPPSSIVLVADQDLGRGRQRMPRLTNLTPFVELERGSTSMTLRLSVEGERLLPSAGELTFVASVAGPSGEQ